MTRSTSEVAACCSTASASFFSSSARGSRLWRARALAFVLVERRPPTRVWLFAPLRDKITSSVSLRSFDHLVGAREQRRWHSEAERLPGLRLRGAQSGSKGLNP